MALTSWESLVQMLGRPVCMRAMISTATVLGAIVIFMLFRRRLRRGNEAPTIIERRLRMIAIGLVLLVLPIFAQLWGAMIIGTEDTQARALLRNLLWTVATGAIIFILVRAAQHALLGSSVTIEAKHKIRLTTSWVGIIVFVLITVLIWASGVKDLGVFLGIIGAGLALSMQETLLSIVGWVLLVVRRPYDIGDRVEIEGRIGDVIDISVFQTSLLEVGNWVGADQSTGRMLILPNSFLVRHAVYNYSKGFPFVWDEFSTIVTFESDWQAARDLMLQQAELEAEKIAGEVQRQIRIMQHRYAIHYEHLQPIVYTSISDVGVQLTLRYLSPVRQRRAINHRISENVLNAFLAHDRIDFAYPTTRFYRNPEEGKPGTGGPTTPRNT